MSRKFIMTSLGYAMIGMLLGIVMAATKNHGQTVAHAHIMLAGFVLSFFYALCHKLWLNESHSTLAKIQFGIHQVGVFVLTLGLFLFYGRYVGESLMDPILAVSSIAVLAAMIPMKVMFLRQGRNPLGSPAASQSL